ncbi:MAG: ferrous iron transport protein A [Candidatus Margulisbacteria bacterium]|nr:ferrous iron transport protein A [Candidatus Margulisiibacteriota bacterium]MBU1867162.1 ferrous iron transport protein A [Candidatus Margulisiibacteriota bacterium]
MLIPLSKMRNGESGVVQEIRGGGELKNRLAALGLRVALNVTRVSGMIFLGPITVKVGHTQIALGHGMAGKVILEVER